MQVDCQTYWSISFIRVINNYKLIKSKLVGKKCLKYISTLETAVKPV